MRLSQRGLVDVRGGAVVIVGGGERDDDDDAGETYDDEKQKASVLCDSTGPADTRPSFVPFGR